MNISISEIPLESLILLGITVGFLVFLIVTNTRKRWREKYNSEGKDKIEIRKELKKGKDKIEIRKELKTGSFTFSAYCPAEVSWFRCYARIESGELVENRYFSIPSDYGPQIELPTAKGSVLALRDSLNEVLNPKISKPNFKFSIQHFYHSQSGSKIKLPEGKEEILTLRDFLNEVLEKFPSSIPESLAERPTIEEEFQALRNVLLKK